MADCTDNMFRQLCKSKITSKAIIYEELGLAKKTPLRKLSPRDVSKYNLLFHPQRSMSGSILGPQKAPAQVPLFPISSTKFLSSWQVRNYKSRDPVCDLVPNQFTLDRNGEVSANPPPSLPLPRLLPRVESHLAPSLSSIVAPPMDSLHQMNAPTPIPIVLPSPTVKLEAGSLFAAANIQAYGQGSAPSQTQSRTYNYPGYQPYVYPSNNNNNKVQFLLHITHQSLSVKQEQL